MYSTVMLSATFSCLALAEGDPTQPIASQQEDSLSAADGDYEALEAIDGAFTRFVDMTAEGMWTWEPKRDPRNRDRFVLPPSRPHDRKAEIEIATNCLHQVTGKEVEIPVDKIRNRLEVSYLIMKQLGGAPTEEQAQEYEKCVKESRKRGENDLYDAEKLECAYDIFGEARMNELVSKGLGEQEALARLAIKAPRRFKRRYRKCVAELIETKDEDEDEAEEEEEEATMRFKPGCFQSLFSEQRLEEMKAFKFSTDIGMSKADRQRAMLDFLSPAEVLMVKTCSREELTVHEWEDLCILGASSEGKFNAWMQGAVDTIDERYLSSFTEEERGGDRQCQDVVEQMSDEDDDKPGCFMKVLGPSEFASIASRVPLDSSEDEILSIMVQQGVGISEFLDINVCLGKKKEDLELLCVRKALGEDPFEEVVAGVDTFALMQEDEQAVAELEKKIEEVVVGEVEDKVGRCVMNVLERHEKMELLCGLDSPEGQQAGSDKCDKRGMGGAGGKKHRRRRHPHRHRSVQVLRRIFKTPPKEVQDRLQKCTSNFSEPLVLSDEEFLPQIYTYLEKIGLPSDEQFKAFHKCMALETRKVRQGKINSRLVSRKDENKSIKMKSRSQALGFFGLKGHKKRFRKGGGNRGSRGRDGQRGPAVRSDKRENGRDGQRGPAVRSDKRENGRDGQRNGMKRKGGEQQGRRDGKKTKYIGQIEYSYDGQRGYNNNDQMLVEGEESFYEQYEVPDEEDVMYEKKLYEEDVRYEERYIENGRDGEKEKGSSAPFIIAVTAGVAFAVLIAVFVVKRFCKRRQRRGNNGSDKTRWASAPPVKVSCVQEFEKKPDTDIESMPSTTFDGAMPV